MTVDQYKQKLTQMINESTDQVAAINSSIDQVQAQIDDLTQQSEAIENAVLNVAANDLTYYLDNTKLPQFQLIDPGASVVYGPTYNSIIYENELTDWKIVDSSNVTMYQYLGVGWDNDQIIIDLIDEWDYGNDYLTRPVTSGASYGIRPYISSLQSAKSLLLENADKVGDTKTFFERFAS